MMTTIEQIVDTYTAKIKKHFPESVVTAEVATRLDLTVEYRIYVWQSRNVIGSGYASSFATAYEIALARAKEFMPLNPEVQVTFKN